MSVISPKEDDILELSIYLLYRGYVNSAQLVKIIIMILLKLKQ